MSLPVLIPLKSEADRKEPVLSCQFSVLSGPEVRIMRDSGVLT